MSSVELISLIVTFVCVVSFSIVFLILFRNYYKGNIEKVNQGQEDIYLIDNAIDEDRLSKSKRRKALRLTGKIGSWVLLSLIALFFAFSLFGRFSGNTMMFGNHSVIVIASGSMSTKNEANTYLKINNLDNQFNTYDVVGITRYSNTKKPELYDVVAYKALDGRTIVHRIIEVQTLASGERVFITRGDSNKSSDTGSLYKDYLRSSEIIGYYNNFRIQGVGIFVIFLQSNAGIITIASIVFCFFMFDRYSSKYQKAVEDRTNLLIELLNYDLANESSAEESGFRTIYKQTIVYKGQSYDFEDGKFVGKTEGSKEDGEVTESHMIVVNQSGDDATIEVKDLNTNKVKVIDNVSKEDANAPVAWFKKWFKGDKNKKKDVEENFENNTENVKNHVETASNSEISEKTQQEVTENEPKPEENIKEEKTENIEPQKEEKPKKKSIFAKFKSWVKVEDDDEEAK